MKMALGRCGWLAGLALSAGAIVMSVGGCSTNPATGRSQLSFYDRDWEIDIGQQAAPGMVQEFGGEVKSPELRAYVEDIGKRLATHTEADNPSLPWTFTLLDSDVINAFALPGGKVFFSRGLAQAMTNEAQMAAVLGHEVGHVTARHTAERISKATLLQGAVQVAGVAADVSGSSGAAQAIPALQVGSELVTLKFGRDQESEADSLGLRYMTKEMYNPRAMVQVMEILKKASEGAGGSEWTSTHPLPETRIERIEGELKERYGFALDDPKYVYKEQEFKTRFLAKLAALPPAPDAERVAARRGVMNFVGGEWVAVNLADPGTWCVHCMGEKK
ncbi:MAG TPA: M48 family metallopeptidase [Phycisphaerales bacterium]|nr:M48 family metallopeptidase [Phycisphaerales bacterium]